MIEFFEMLNGCSGTRTTAYLVFILMLAFIIFSGISDILRVILNREKVSENNTNSDENDDDDLDNPSQPWNYRKTEERETLN